MLNIITKIIKKTNHDFEYIDLGGGFGIDYMHNNQRFNLKKYSSDVHKFLKKINQKLFLNL